MPVLVHCTDTSVQSTSLSPTEIAALVRPPRTNNVRNGITGFLLHLECTFLQVLKGPSNVAHDFYSSRSTRILYEALSRPCFGGCSNGRWRAGLFPQRIAERGSIA